MSVRFGAGRCWSCAQTFGHERHQATFACDGCGAWMVTTSDGESFPRTAMGYQAAEWHELSLRRPVGEAPVELELRGYGRSLTVRRDGLTVAKTEQHERGSRTWYPLTMRWSGRRGRTLRLRRGWDDRVGVGWGGRR